MALGFDSIPTKVLFSLGVSSLLQRSVISYQTSGEVLLFARTGLMQSLKESKSDFENYRRINLRGQSFYKTYAQAANKMSFYYNGKSM